MKSFVYALMGLAAGGAWAPHAQAQPVLAESSAASAASSSAAPDLAPSSPTTSTASASPVSTAATVGTLGTVVVSSEREGEADGSGARQALSGPELDARRGATLGETLQGLPGVSASGFGPNASRPVLRGLDGDRARILDNGGAMADVSSLSEDHAVAVDPLSVERVELLRGPATLRYGSSAIGGVVNVQDNRISAEPLFEPSGGLTGQADLSTQADPGHHAASGQLDTGTDRYTLHVDGFERRSPDLRSRQALCETTSGQFYTSQRICNSGSSSQGGGLGGTLYLNRGHIGWSHSQVQMRYGTVAEPQTHIGLHREQTRLAGSWRLAVSGLESLSWQWGQSRYEHTEYDGDQPSTRFTQDSHDGRAELRHSNWLGFHGLLGAQWASGYFSADGEEAYAPYSRHRQQALFVFEERPMFWGRWQWAWRGEEVSVASLGHPQVARLNDSVGERRFQPRSMSSSVAVPLGDGWEASGQWSVGQRAPQDSELLANGPHAATHVFEVGNPRLGVETSRSLEAGLAWKSSAVQWQLQAWTSHIADYIALRDSGVKVSAQGETETSPGSGVSASGAVADLPRYVYQATTARLSGLEFNGSLPLSLPGSGAWRGRWRADWLRADDLEQGQPLPRTAPGRLGLDVQHKLGPWSTQLGLDHFFAATRVAPGQTPAAGYTLWNLRTVWQLRRSGDGQLQAYARLDNLSDVKAFSATSILTQTAPGKSPLPGRSLSLGLKWMF